MSQNQTLPDLEQLRQKTLLDTSKKMRDLCNEIISVVVNFPGTNSNLQAQVNQLFRVRAALEQVDTLYRAPADQVMLTFKVAPGEDQQAELRKIQAGLCQLVSQEHVHVDRITCDSKFHEGLLGAVVSFATVVGSTALHFAEEWVKAAAGRTIEINLNGVKVPAGSDEEVRRAALLLQILQKQELERQDLKHQQGLETIRLEHCLATTLNAEATKAARLASLAPEQDDKLK